REFPACGKNDTPAGKIEILTLGELVHRYPKMREPVIDGLARRGEIMNFISTTKVGKSWAVAGLALTTATGRIWLDTFQTTAGRVLIIDNELHPETLAARLKKVAESLLIPFAEVQDRVTVISLRGNLRDLYTLRTKLERFGPRYFHFIVIDALYRMFTDYRGESDNNAITQFYNELDRLAAATDCCIAVVHHGTKGSQADKNVTDVGSGAGAQSRACDTHVIFREHEEKNVAVLEVALRSFAPVEPLCVRWEYPLWHLADGLDPARLKRPANQNQDRQ